MFELKKGMSLGTLPYAVLMLVFIGIISGVGMKINTQMISTETSASTATALALANSTAGIAQIPANMTLLGTIIALSAVITILWSSFGGMLGGRGGASV